MALSMTGYGRGINTDSEYTVTVDLKSVNHRYLELFFKLPRPYGFLEDRLRREIASRISRGKLEITVQVDRTVPETIQVTLNKPLLDSYMKAIEEIKTRYQPEGTVNIESLLNLPDVFSIVKPEEDQERLSGLAVAAITEALDSLIAMRRNEGNGLCRDIREKLDYLEQLRTSLLEWAPQIVLHYQERLIKRVHELTGGLELDPNRITNEVAIFADKSDITEELVRIDSHLRQFAGLLKLSEPTGRRLDFLIQELNREINTIGSKASDLKAAQIVIAFKAELEKIREQIQNIE